MTDKQLAVLLFHLMRQVNGCSVEVKKSLRARGATLDESLADNAVVQLQALASVLEDQAASLNGGEDHEEFRRRARTIAELEAQHRADSAKYREAFARYDEAQRMYNAIWLRGLGTVGVPWSELTLEERLTRYRRPTWPWWGWVP